MKSGRKSDGKLYRVIVKDGCHINKKRKADGSKSAIQFTNDTNELDGPLDIIEVDENELSDLYYYNRYGKSQTVADFFLGDIVVPVTKEILYQAFMVGYDKLSMQINDKVVPKVNEKMSTFAKDAKMVMSVIKDGVTGKETKASELLKEIKKSEKKNEDSMICYEGEGEKTKHEKKIRSQEEIRDIVYAMKCSAFMLVASIKMLNDTIIADDGTNPALRLEIQKNLEAFSWLQIKEQIELLLEEKNNGLFDEASRKLLVAFRDGYFLVNDCKVPISKYLG